MADVYRVVGPPGTGKTSYVARQCRRAVEKYGEAGVVVCSLTKAAASEAAGRDTGVEPENVGTLHALCYRALGRPKLMVGDLIKEWNREHPMLALSGRRDSIDDRDDEAPDGAKVGGDDDAALMDVLRARREDPASWPAQALHFREAWERFKKEHEAWDFTDLIERAVDDLSHAPGRPSALFVDEAQDLSRIELDLIQHWAASVQQVVVVGDPWQAIYSWRGASPDVLSGAPHKLLEDSFRVPRAVHAAAIDLMKRSGDWREDVVYRPRAFDGEVVHLMGQNAASTRGTGANWRDPEAIVQLALEAMESGPTELEDGSLIPTQMILASCDYMLGPIKKALREAAVPYGSPYSHRWNPLSKEARNAARAILNPVRDDFGGPAPTSEHLWTPDQLRAWAPHFRVASSPDADDGVFVRGKRADVEAASEDLSPAESQRLVIDSCTPAAVHALGVGDVAWLAERTLKSSASLAYALRCVARWGWRAIDGHMPAVTISTIHGAKGGQARDVTLIPDLAPAATRQYLVAGWDHRDAIFRQFYVGMTRARERLFVAARVRGGGGAMTIGGDQ